MQSPKHPCITQMLVLCIKRECSQMFYLSKTCIGNSVLCLIVIKNKCACKNNGTSQDLRLKSVGVCWDSHLVARSH